MADIFQSPEHKQRFLEAIQYVEETQDMTRRYESGYDTEYATALFLLTAHPGIWERARDFIDKDGIDFEAMLLQVDFSGGQSVLVRMAWHLFNYMSGHIEPIELLRLDTHNFCLALLAIQTRKYGFDLIQ